MTHRDNILAAWRASTADDLAQGLAWYGVAGELADAFATGPVSKRTAAGVIAAMSPMMSWPANVSIARRLIAEHANNPTAAPPNGFGLKTNVAKAWRILNGEDPADVLTSRKVSAFFANIMGDAGAVTIDRWAKRAALADPTDSGVVKGNREYDVLADAYRDAAAAAGVSPHDLQAAVWVWIRRTTARIQYTNPTAN